MLIMGVISLLVISLTVKAENFSTYPTEYNANDMHTYNEVQEVTSSNSAQTGYEMGYITPKKINIAEKECNYCFGMRYFKDPYNKKTFIFDVENNSPAMKMGLRIGDEILKIDNEKIKKLQLEQIDNILNQKQAVKLEIKTSAGIKKDINLTKANVCTTKINSDDELFNTYWNQVCSYPYDLDNGLKISQNLLKVNLSYYSRRDLDNEIQRINYWLAKRNKFKNGYNVCRMNLDEYSVNKCLAELVNRELTQIQHEETLRQQQAALEAQQRMQQQQINALNNYSYAIQNQRMQVDTNVYHSGTVNVNSNVNVNGRYNHYHY